MDGASYNADADTLTFPASMLNVDRAPPARFYFYAQISDEDGPDVVELLPVTVVRGSRPVVSIRCVHADHCPSNGSRAVDATGTLPLVGHCANCAADERLHYDWTVQAADTALGRDIAAVSRRHHGKQFTLDVRALNCSSPFHTIRLTGACNIVSFPLLRPRVINALNQTRLRYTAR